MGDNVGDLSNPRLIIRSHLRFTVKYNLQLIPRDFQGELGLTLKKFGFVHSKLRS